MLVWLAMRALIFAPDKHTDRSLQEDQQARDVLFEKHKHNIHPQRQWRKLQCSIPHHPCSFTIMITSFWHSLLLSAHLNLDGAWSFPRPTIRQYQCRTAITTAVVVTKARHPSLFCGRGYVSNYALGSVYCW